MFLLYSVTARDFLVKDLSAILQKYEQKKCTKILKVKGNLKGKMHKMYPQGNVNYS